MDETEEEETLDASSPKTMIQRDPSSPTSPSRKRKGFVVGEEEEEEEDRWKKRKRFHF